MGGSLKNIHNILVLNIINVDYIYVTLALARVQLLLRGAASKYKKILNCLNKNVIKLLN